MPTELEESDFIEQLRPCRFCHGLDEAQIARVAESCLPRQLTPGETLAEPDDPVSSVYTVLRGRLKIFNLGEGE